MEIQCVSIKLKNGGTIEVSFDELQELCAQMDALFGPRVPVQPQSVPPLIGSPPYRIGDFPEMYKVGDFPNQYNIGDVNFLAPKPTTNT